MESALLNECSKDFWQRLDIQIARLPPEDMHKVSTNEFVPNVLQENGQQFGESWTSLNTVTSLRCGDNQRIFKNITVTRFYRSFYFDIVIF